MALDLDGTITRRGPLIRIRLGYGLFSAILPGKKVESRLSWYIQVENSGIPSVVACTSTCMFPDQRSRVLWFFFSFTSVLQKTGY